jgi:molybdate transport system permease protein
MPIAVYITLQNDPDGAILLSLFLVAVSILVLVSLRGRWIGAG